MNAKNNLFVAVSLLGLFTVDGIASAATATSSAQVSVNVPRKCSISAAALSFGSYDPFGLNATTDLDASSTIDVVCSKNSSVSIGINAGQSPGGGSSVDAPVRQLANGTELLRYDLFTDSSRTAVWGDIGGTRTQAYTSASKNTVTTLTVFGRVPRNQDVSDGAYTDQITATVLF
ncbi:MAG TPA: spore coat U domain-containing protein [Myxococcaceae bacterium]|nr:spore coat U domain-containing protein [Myxococcaceae bacterium]